MHEDIVIIEKLVFPIRFLCCSGAIVACNAQAWPPFCPGFLAMSWNLVGILS